MWLKLILQSSSHAKWKGTEPPMCVVTEPWICRLRFPASNCERRVKPSDITCWIYSAHVSSGMYGGLESFQTATSFQSGRAFFLAYFLVFSFSASYQKSRNLHYTNIFYELMTNEILIFKIKNIFLALIEYWHVSKQYRWNYCW